MNYSPSRIERGADPTGITENMIALEREGYVISFCWHWNAPTNLIDTPSHEWWRGFYTHATTFDVDAALADTNSSEYALLLRDIDAIAIELQKISGAGIPVLWRPLHESEGGWFWWGAKGPEPFKELWRLLYTRLTENHNLHNLIWVLTSEDPAWYPGNDVVDIVGADGYPSDRNDTLSSRWEVLKARFDGVKLLALTEFGGVPDIERMHQFGVWWAYFAPWGGSLGPGSEPASKVGRIYQSAEVLTLDELNARPPMFTSIHTLNGRAVGLQGKGPRGSGWDLLGTSDPTLPAATWPQVAEGTFTGGVFQYIDTTATNDPHRFYRIEKP